MNWERLVSPVKWHLSTQLLVTFSSATILIALIFGEQAANREISYYKQEKQQEYEQLLRAVSQSARDAIMSEDSAVLGRLARDLINNDDNLGYVIISNDEGNPLVTHGVLSLETDTSAPIWFIEERVMLGESYQGGIRAQIDLSAAMISIRERAAMSQVWLSALLLLLGVVLVAGTYVMAIRPISQISRRVTELGNGDYRTDFDVRASHELKELASELNAVAKTLNAQRKAEASRKQELERTVDERTKDLRKSQTETDSLLVKAEQQAEKLKELDKQKTAFFQNMSHELRTPLTLILNPLELATERIPDDKNIAVATKNARRLLRLVNQLLDFQKIEAGKKKLKLQTLNLSRFTHICGDYFASACSSKEVEFTTTIHAQTTTGREDTLYIRGEVDALEKVAFNLLSNALKFTPKGGRIELGLSKDSDKARLYVRDTGPGISEEGQGKLFQVFSQVDETTTRDYEGSGLGLALVKSLVEEMGGEVGVDSELGKGSTFWADFPMCDASEEEALNFESKDWLLADAGGQTGTDDSETLEALSNITEGSNELVLVVDDLVDMRNLIGNFLKKQNYRVAAAPNGKRGVEIARELKPSLIITDWMMPVMSGPELIETIRRDDEIKGTPIILLTAKSDQESKVIGKGIGADAFLGKPFNDAEFSSTVQNLVRLKEGEKEIAKLNRFLTESVLKRYLPPDLIEKIVNGELSMDKPAEMRKVTILFSDLCGFTSTSRALGPAAISDLLNEYLTTMNDIIFSHGGTIDKFIGDAIMVVFGAPSDMQLKEQAERAIACANDMQAAMFLIAKAWELRRAGHLKMRIGIHQGDAVVGNFGSDRRSDYTCIGPTVNLASRIESACGPGRVFMSNDVCAHLEQSQTQVAGTFDLKGVGEVELYELS